MKVIRTDVACPRCREPLCSVCGLNGHCEECDAPISKDTDRRLQAAIRKLQQAKGQQP